MRPVFVQFRCIPGKTYEVADAIYDREIVSELYSTSGDYDLMAKIYVPEDQDVGRDLAGFFERASVRAGHVEGAAARAYRGHRFS